MKNQRGFTLLEIILALVIFASCAMMVVSTIPARSGADIFGQQLKALVDYGSDRAVMDGNIVGLVIATDKYQLVTLDDKNGERHWVPLSAGRITTKGDFPEEMHVSLSPQRLAAMRAAGLGQQGGCQYSDAGAGALTGSPVPGKTHRGRCRTPD
ncbi:prepilin-type N-terminal cleavage/methylation domain-containing protein [Enterobacter roggenkampii]|uniref:prepilin-type N-terminal cleavage/methylation domain-containing protein n=1 Tax=Enterobacter roggenkampii TaxID=1812935 RepID=UPI00200673CA|nr:prepilin-type N-terminal cleavage/methylation domain-containing protein [Enterobacter roggenkampii]MCK7074591.1 prepilin-type N-terminal cleavage/methylation domain-containing protein [Enterobacter roggenkampii]